MRKNKGVRRLLIALCGLAAIFIFSQGTMLLWNHLMPAIFGLPFISAW